MRRSRRSAYKITRYVTGFSEYGMMPINGQNIRKVQVKNDSSRNSR